MNVRFFFKYVLAGLLLVAAVQTATPAIAQWSKPQFCPVDKKYYSLRSTPDNWQDAKVTASRTTHEGKPGRLASDFPPEVKSWLFNKYAPLKPGYVLIGGYREGNNGAKVGWLWFRPGYNPVPMNMSQAFWLINEPNNFKSKESVAAMDFDRGGNFVDLSPNGRYYFLVQY